MNEYDPKTAPQLEEMKPEVALFRDVNIAMKPRFDAKITKTTKGYTWEIEVKDCPDATLGKYLSDQARAVIERQISWEDRIVSEETDVGF